MPIPIELRKPNKEVYTKEEVSMVDKMHKEILYYTDFIK